MVAVCTIDAFAFCSSDCLDGVLTMRGSSMPGSSPLRICRNTQVELGFGTPYLLSLGVPKALISIVWLAGPLSGLLVQPIVGSYSDNATFKLGRRRPFVIGESMKCPSSIRSSDFAFHALQEERQLCACRF